MTTELPIPAHFDPTRVGEIWRVPYHARADEARHWARQHTITRANEDSFTTCLILVDVQNTFCAPGFELFVGGRSGMGAVEDNQRLCRFIYRNLGRITRISPTLDTHQAMQIFHPAFFLDDAGEHPEPYTLITAADLREGRWRINPAVADSLGADYGYLTRYVQFYADELARRGKFELTIWPYHAMLGGIGHALVSAVEEAVFFHSVARYSQPDFVVKGRNPLTEHYSAVGPEVTTGPDGEPIAEPGVTFVQELHEFDAVIIAGQAKSHCVAWTIDDLLGQILAREPALARKVYLLDDCSSPVVVPGAIDYTEQAEAAFRKFADHGMNLVHSTTPMFEWPGMPDF